MLTVVRESQEMSQTKLAAAAGISQSAVSQIEAGVITPTDDVVERLAGELHCPVSLLQVPLQFQQLPVTFFRRKSRVRVRDVKAIRARVNLYRLRIEILLRAFDLPEARILHVDAERDGLSPSEAAQRLRVYWNVPPGPIVDLTALIEAYGIIVVPIDFGNDAVDGLSLYEPSDTVPPMIFVNPNFPPDRWRMSLAHELGHIVLHHHLNVPPSNEQLEDEAFEFAAELLMPKREIAAQLRHVSMHRLASLKVHWRVAMGALLMRAQRLGYITKSRAKPLWIQLRKGGMREPVEIAPEKASTVGSMVAYHTEELGYSIPDLSKLLHQEPDELQAEFGLRKAHLHLA